MRKYTREEKLNLAKHLLADGGWAFFCQNARQQIDMKKLSIGSDFGDPCERAFRDGVIAGLEWALKFPKEQEESNAKFLEMVNKKIFGE